MLIKRYKVEVEAKKNETINGKQEYIIKVSELNMDQLDKNPREPIKQRYSQLREFHEKLANMVGKLKLQIEMPSFPKRSLFGKTNQKEDRIKQRSISLEFYFNELLNIDKLQSFPCVKYFLPEQQHIQIGKLQVSVIGGQKQEPSNRRITQQIQVQEENQNNQPQQNNNQTNKYEADAFKLKFIDNKEQWEYKLRFKELEGIHDALQDQGLIQKNLKLPNSKHFKNNQDNQSEIMENTRKMELAMYFDDLFAAEKLQAMLQSEIIQYVIAESKKYDTKMKKLQEMKKSLCSKPEQ